ncbi:MAG: transposase [Patescibacteria group bacterium]|jgi:putative transposase|nr:transposase [Patescibacteria group bacterium]MDD5172827.1 transposase [Patescibacteria group bacterium]
MSLKNSLKIYIKDGIYHIYNRGIEKRNIFLDEQDYKVFLYYLKSYLTPVGQQEKPPYGIDRNVLDFTLYKQIRLFCFCLMPNHFHLMIQQLTERAIIEFMKRLTNAYVRYFNEKYDRKSIGPLFQGKYKAVLIKKEQQFLYLPYYIHFHNPEGLYRNKRDAELIKKIQNYPWSSYADYLGKRDTKWIYKKGIMEQFMETEEIKPETETTRKILGSTVID